MRHQRHYSRQGSFLTRLPWWFWLSLAIANAVFFWFFLDSVHLPGWETDRFRYFLDMTLHTRAARYAGLVLSVLMVGLAVASSLRGASRRRLLYNKRTLAQLREMSWQEFEMLVGEAFSKLGYEVEETGGGGADGGIDLNLWDGDEKIIVQCKRWASSGIGAPIVREMYGLMAHHEAIGVKIVCVGKFTKSAVEFAEGKPIELIGGEELVALLEHARKS